jgi:hypothetical protein
MKSSKINIFKILPDLPNTQIVKKGDVLLNKGIKYAYISNTIDGYIKMSREDDEICFTSLKNFNSNFKFENIEEISDRFLKHI